MRKLWEKIMRLSNEELREETDVQIGFDREDSRTIAVRRVKGKIDDKRIQDFFKKFLSGGRFGYSCVGLSNGEYVVHYRLNDKINGESYVAYGNIEEILRQIKESMTIQEKIDQAEQESNDPKKIEQEKRKFDALQDWSKKPRYQMPENTLERSKRWLFRLFKEEDWCEKHKMQYREHGFEGLKHCPECRREWYKK